MGDPLIDWKQVHNLLDAHVKFGQLGTHGQTDGAVPTALTFILLQAANQFAAEAVLRVASGIESDRAGIHQNQGPMRWLPDTASARSNGSHHEWQIKKDPP